MKTFKFLLFILLSWLWILIPGCRHEDLLKPGEGFIDVKGGKLWYRVVGEGHKTPILLLHGGPGATSYNLNPLAVLGKNRPVIFFDQLGGGRSDHITDTTLMTIENYVGQVEQVRKTLGLKDYFLFGHSWGTMLGMDFYLKYPDGIKGIIFSGPVMSVPLYLKGVDTLLGSLPDSIQTAIYTNEKKHTYDAPAYKQANKVWMQHFFSRRPVRSADMDSGSATFGAVVYDYMWGPTEFTSTGPLKDYDRTGMLPGIKVPVLFMVAEFDEVLASAGEFYQSLVPGSKFAIIPNAGHLSTQDNPEACVSIIDDFLKEREND